MQGGISDEGIGQGVGFDRKGMDSPGREMGTRAAASLERGGVGEGVRPGGGRAEHLDEQVEGMGWGGTERELSYESVPTDGDVHG